jgi:cell division protease FtsH
MAGRAAEELVFKEISTGAADDITRATDIARQIATRFGMVKELGQAVFERQSSSYLADNVIGMRQKDYSDETAEKIDLAVKRLIDEAYVQAKKVLTSRRKDLDEGAKILLEKETITPDDFPPLLPAKERKLAAE